MSNDRADFPSAGDDRRLAEYQSLVRRQLELVGEDPSREGLARTPERVAAAMEFLTRGYDTSLREAVGEGIFADEHDNMIMVRDVELYSLCEHHLLPFFGKAHVAYVPDGKLVGLSKVPRVLDHFARRLQVQERLGEEVAQCLVDAVQPRGLGIVLEATHLCMVMRGVQKEGSRATTSTLKGSFLSDARARSEFMALAGLKDPLL